MQTCRLRVSFIVQNTRTGKFGTSVSAEHRGEVLLRKADYEQRTRLIFVKWEG